MVISIIALLAGILMPALARTRECGRSILCLSNLRQLTVAAQLYTDNFSDYYPLSYMTDPDLTDNLSIQTEWDFKRTKDFSTGETTYEPGLLWQGEGVNTRVYECPSYAGYKDPFSGAPYTGYNYNSSYIGGYAVMDTLVRSAKTSSVYSPSECALFGEGQRKGGLPNKFMRSPLTGTMDAAMGAQTRAAGTQGYRHLDRTNVAYCDGSARSTGEIHVELGDGPIATGCETEIKSSNETADVKTGFLSPDNSAYNLE